MGGIAKTSAGLVDGVLELADIPDNSITGDKLAPNTVTNSKMATDAIKKTNIQNNAVNSDKVDEGDSYNWSGVHDHSGGSVVLAAATLGTHPMRAQEHSQSIAELIQDDATAIPTPDDSVGSVLGTGNEGLIEALASPGAAVRIQVGGTGYNTQGTRLVIGTTASLAIAARSSGGNTRKDIIVISAAGVLTVRQGTEDVSPSDPTLTAGDLVLARVNVDDEGTLTVEGADVDDLRERGTISGDKIQAESIPTGAIEDDAITTPKILNSAVTGVKIAPGTVTRANLVDAVGKSFAQIAFPVVGSQSGNNIDVEVEIQYLDAGVAGVQNFTIVVSDDQYLDEDAASTTLAITPAADGTVLDGTGTAVLVVTSETSNSRFDVRVTEAGAKTVYLHVRNAPGGPIIKAPAAQALTFA